MANEWSSSQVDTRNFSTQINRVVDDLNRLDLINQATTYLQDAVRYFQRRPFFFTDVDNAFVPQWGQTTQGGLATGGLSYTHGATIQAVSTIDQVNYAWVAMNSGTAGAAAPVWSTNVLFTPPGNPFFPPPPNNTPGTILDNGGPPNGIIWANVGPYTQGVTTGLSTIYNINQYIMPIELINITRLEVTWQGNLRIGMVEISYDELRDYDVVRPPPATYPAWYAWYKQRVYLWPYPVGQFPITLSYIGPPPIPKLPTDSNVWTTQAEACVRQYAEGLIQRLVLHDEQAAQTCFAQSELEFMELVSHGIRQTQNAGITPSAW